MQGAGRTPEAPARLDCRREALPSVARLPGGIHYMERPGPDLVIACPNCSAPARMPDPRSGNTFGAKLWTDGFLDAPMLASVPPVTICHACKRLYWLSDARQLGEIAPEEIRANNEARQLDDSMAPRW